MIKVAVVQESPVMLDADRTIDKLVSRCQEIRKTDPDLVLFPEAFIPGYPRGLGFGAKVGFRSSDGKTLWLEYWNNSIEIHDERFQRLSDCAKELNSMLVVGITEKDPADRGLYCTMVYFGPDGQYLGKHRKLKPTGTERVIWGEGHGDTLLTVDTGDFVTGGLICWENYMPLARMAMYRKGVQLYLAPTADCRENWQHTMRHIAVEGRCFVLTCNQVITRDIYPDHLLDEIGDNDEILCTGGSAIIAPTGEMLAGPLYNETGVLTAELDLDLVTKGKFELSVTGHYNRPDVFKFDVPDQPETIKTNPIR